MDKYLDSLVALLFGGYSTLLLGLFAFLGKVQLNRVKNNHKKENEQLITQLKGEFNQKLEILKNELQIKKSDIFKQRKVYEELIEILEKIFSDDEIDFFQINKIIAYMSIYAPDDVYNNLSLTLKKSGKRATRNQLKCVIYSSIRKSIFGDNTNLTTQDIIPQITEIKSLD